MYLESVHSRLDVGDVHPLAVDVVRIRVGAVDGYALVAVVGALEHRLLVIGALVVLQTERRLVPLGHFDARRVDDVEVGKHFHAVIMPATESHDNQIRL